MADEESIEDLPPSAKLIYKTLEQHGELTQKELIDETMLSARTVRYGLGRLEEADCINERVHFRDARQSVYSLVRDDQQHTTASSDPQIAE